MRISKTTWECFSSGKFIHSEPPRKCNSVLRGSSARRTVKQDGGALTDQCPLLRDFSQCRLDGSSVGTENCKDPSGTAIFIDYPGIQSTRGRIQAVLDPVYALDHHQLDLATIAIATSDNSNTS